jgi:hypothetical protein
MLLPSCAFRRRHRLVAERAAVARLEAATFDATKRALRRDAALHVGRILQTA